MGLFDWLKKKNFNTIVLPEKLQGAFIQPLSTSRLEITLGEKLVVLPGYAVVIVVKDKPQDVFTEGEYTLNLATLPKTTQALHLNREKIITRSGRKEKVFPSSFLCDLYFVNLASFSDNSFETGDVVKKDSKYGRFKVSIKGKYSFKTNIPSQTIALFLIENSHIKPGKAIEKLNSFISQVCEEWLDNNKITNPYTIRDDEGNNISLLQHLTKNFAKYGLEIEKVNITITDFDRHIDLILLQENRDVKLNSRDIVENLEKELDEITQPTSNDNLVLVEKGAVLENNNTVSKSVEDKKSIEDNKNYDSSKKTITKKEVKSQIKDNKARKVSKPKDKPKEKVQSQKEVRNPIAPLTKKEQNSEKTKVDKKICPKCGKENLLDQQICDCGCFLDENLV